MPRRSVLSPCRGAEGTLHEAVASLDGQSFRDFEVVVVDDDRS